MAVVIAQFMLLLHREVLVVAAQPKLRLYLTMEKPIKHLVVGAQDLDSQVARAAHETQFTEVAAVAARTDKGAPGMNLITCTDLTITAVTGMVL